MEDDLTRIEGSRVVLCDVEDDIPVSDNVRFDRQWEREDEALRPRLLDLPRFNEKLMDWLLFHNTKRTRHAFSNAVVAGAVPATVRIITSGVQKYLRSYGNLRRMVSNGSLAEITMAKICDITGKRSQVGGGYSNRTRATKFNPTGKRRRHVNMQKKTLFVPELGKNMTINVSARGLKVLKKRGVYRTLKAAGLV